jgi:hypothetical protein
VAAVVAFAGAVVSLLFLPARPSDESIVPAEFSPEREVA